MTTTAPRKAGRRRPSAPVDGGPLLPTSSPGGRRARGATLDATGIVDAARAIVARDGLDGLTMRQLAADLGVTAGALYNHVRGRDEVVRLLVEELMARIPDPIADGADPWQAIFDLTMRVEDELDRVPGLAPALLEYAVDSPRGKRLRRQMVGAYQATGLDPQQARAAYRALLWLWLGNRISVGGRRQTPGEIADFRLALAALIEGLRGLGATGTSAAASPGTRPVPRGRPRRG